MPWATWSSGILLYSSMILILKTRSTVLFWLQVNVLSLCITASSSSFQIPLRSAIYKVTPALFLKTWEFQIPAVKFPSSLQSSLCWIFSLLLKEIWKWGKKRQCQRKPKQADALSFDAWNYCILHFNSLPQTFTLSWPKSPPQPNSPVHPRFCKVISVAVLRTLSFRAWN